MKNKSLDEEKKHNYMDSKKTLTCLKKFNRRREIQNNLNGFKKLI